MILLFMLLLFYFMFSYRVSQKSSFIWKNMSTKHIQCFPIEYWICFGWGLGWYIECFCYVFFFFYCTGIKKIAIIIKNTSIYLFQSFIKEIFLLWKKETKVLTPTYYIGLNGHSDFFCLILLWISRFLKSCEPSVC